MKTLNGSCVRGGNFDWVTRMFGQSFVSIDRGAHISPDCMMDGNEIAVVLSYDRSTLVCCWYSEAQSARAGHTGARKFSVPVSKVGRLNCQQKNHLQSGGPCLIDEERRRAVASVLDIIDGLEAECVTPGREGECESVC